MKVEVWTYFATPFRVGGPVWSPQKAEFEAKEFKTIKGVKLLKVVIGSRVVAVEASTGGIVGTLRQAVGDLKLASKEEIQAQLETFKNIGKGAMKITTEDFIATYCKT